MPATLPSMPLQPPPLSVHRRIQELLLGFSRGISATLSVAGALEALCGEVNDLFGTRTVSVWIHNRRARSSSSPRIQPETPPQARASRPTRIHAAAASGWRASFHPSADGERVLVAPLPAGGATARCLEGTPGSSTITVRDASPTSAGIFVRHSKTVQSRGSAARADCSDTFNHCSISRRHRPRVRGCR